jgi:peptidoglycan/LPS O-acetylase OafA/YrhL
MSLQAQAPLDIALPGTSKPGLRTDIQALRGIAVLLVVLYHAGLKELPAGYLGVDIFFVISGFLITGLIRKEMEAGTFSFARFYYRRAKRLLPAAYTVIFITVLLSPLFVNQIAMEDLKSQVLGALTFTANYVLHAQTGYFEEAGETKAFLHFWSLAIEEQYYLVMPLALTLLPRKLWLPVIGGVAVLLAVASPFFAIQDPDMAFFFPHTRAWELAIGSVGALVAGRVGGHRILSLARLPAIVVVLVIPFFPTGLPHPGVDSLLVCLGTLVIILGHDGGRWERSIAPRTLAFVGDFSYSLYLVHWPVMVFIKSAWILHHPPLWVMASGVAASVVLSWLLYRFVEEPLRGGFEGHAARTVGALVSASLLLAALPHGVAKVTASDTDFAALRRTNYGLDRACVFTTSKNPFTGTPPAECRTTEHPRVFIWGDSHAMAWAPGLAAELPDLGLEQATMSACAPIVGLTLLRTQGIYAGDWNKHCLNFHLAVFDYIRANPNIEIVVLAAHWRNIIRDSGQALVKVGDTNKTARYHTDMSIEKMKATIEELRALGKKVVILASIPENGTNVGDCYERWKTGRLIADAPKDCALPLKSTQEYGKSTADFLERLKKEADVDVISPNEWLCDEKRCVSHLDDTLLYRDGGHISIKGSLVLARKMHLGALVLSRAR